jgi:hypothetical protein
MKAVAALCTLAVAAALTAQTSQADARMGGRGGGRMMGGFQRPMMQPAGSVRGSVAVAPRTRGFYPTVGSFEVKRPPSARIYDYPGAYAGRFDGVDKGGSARSVAANETITVHGNRTEKIGGSAGEAPSYPYDGFRGGVGVASSGKSSTWIRMWQPHAGAASSRHIRHRGFSIVDRTQM